MKAWGKLKNSRRDPKVPSITLAKFCSELCIWTFAEGDVTSGSVLL